MRNYNHYRPANESVVSANLQRTNRLRRKIRVHDLNWRTQYSLGSPIVFLPRRSCARGSIRVYATDGPYFPLVLGLILRGFSGRVNCRSRRA
jgi:hypothetical protein